jgi:hypothetical protein
MVTVVTIIIIVMIGSPVISGIGTLPTINIKELSPGNVPVVPQSRVPVPMAKRLVAFQPIRHMFHAPRLNPVVG